MAAISPATAVSPATVSPPSPSPAGVQPPESSTKDSRKFFSPVVLMIPAMVEAAGGSLSSGMRYTGERQLPPPLLVPEVCAVTGGLWAERMSHASSAATVDVQLVPAA